MSHKADSRASTCATLVGLKTTRTNGLVLIAVVVAFHGGTVAAAASPQPAHPAAALIEKGAADLKKREMMR